jgi:predicted ATPase/DNA-binding CsgD family transcriptional regulator
LIGREQEIVTVCSLLGRPEVRLLVLTGPGGVGKTRLGIQVATNTTRSFADGVHSISLASLRHPDLVLPSIAHALGLGDSGELPVLEHLRASLEAKHLLLFLDNFEQVIGAAPLLAELLQACPALKALITSRELVRIRGAHDFPVLPLALPDIERLPAVERLSRFPAIALFAQRAHAINPNFTLTETNARPIAEICARLDGLPLAIELAAARSNLLPPETLLVRLRRRLQVLTGGQHDLPARQQTLRSAITWSYDLLNEQEQRLFRRLSVFVGGCTLETIEALSTLQGETIDLLDGVGSLLDKSLLQQSEQGGGEPRLLMLETIREFALECLSARRETGEEERTRHCHALYYLAVAEEAEVQTKGMQQTKWLERALAAGSEVAPSLRAKALYANGALAYIQDDNSQAESCFQASLALYRQLGEQRGMGISLYKLGLVAWSKGDYPAARALYGESLALTSALHDRWGMAACLEGLAYVGLSLGDSAWTARLGGAAEAMRQSLGVPVPLVERADYEDLLRRACAQLDVASFETAWAEGHAMTPAQVLTSQLSVKTSPHFKESSSSPGSSTSPASAVPAGLTSREGDVLRLIAMGLTDSQVAKRLVISPRTVNAHLTSIYSKIGVSTRSAATRYALDHKLI